MHFKNIFAIFILLGLSLSVRSQDLHFTYFQMSPLVLNPALTGAFEGSFRVGAHYRGQWSDVSGYKTPTLYLDAPVIRGLREQDWVGVGISFFRDQAGSGSLINSGGHLSFAYHFGLGKDARTILSLGGQYGSISRKLGNVSGLTFRDEFAGGGNQSPDKQELLNAFGPNSDSNNSATDWNAGIMLNTVINNDSKFKMGIMAGHLTSSDLSLLSDTDKSKLKITAFAQLTQLINSRVRFEPALLFQTRAQSSEIELHGILGYLFDPEKGIVLNAGLGYRVSGSAQVLMGAEYKDLKVGAAFDLNTSGFQSAPGLQSAFELGVSYIVKIYKKPNVKPVIFCPRF